MNESKANLSEPAQGSRPLVFLVDDEPMLLEFATLILEPAGYALQSFRDPQSALEAFASARQKPALIITDYAMHTMTGLDLMAACRRLEPRQKVLLLSGTVDERVYSNTSIKPDAFLAKPYQAGQLVEIVKSMLSA